MYHTHLRLIKMKMMHKKDDHLLIDNSDFDTLKDAYEKLLLKVLCSICHDKTKKVVSVNCGHHFCRPCILKHLGKSETCPLCETAVSKDTIITNKAITVFFEQLQQILAQCERHLPAEVIKEIKKKHSDTPTIVLDVPTPRRKSVRSSLAGAEILAGALKKDATKSLTSASPGIFGTAQQNEKHHFKTPTRLPSQLPTESAVVSEVSVDPEDIVATWLKKAVPGSNAPTQERPINSNSLITQTTLVSASQAGILKIPNLPRRSTPGKVADEAEEISNETSQPEVEVSQADSIVVAKKPQRKSSARMLDRTDDDESEIVLECGSELFQSQSDEYQKKKDEKRIKKLEDKLDSSFEKKGVKGIGLRRRKPTPAMTEPEPECISSDSESDEIAPRKKKTVCIISDEEADDEPSIFNHPGHVGLMETTIADFVDNAEKSNSFKKYSNKRQSLQKEVEEVIPRGCNSLLNFPVTSLISEKRSRLSLRASPKTLSIVEVISPVSSPSTKAKERQEELRPNVNAKVISSFKEMKSNFKEKMKKPLNVSTSSAPYVIATGRGKRMSIGSREMIIESASGKNTPASSATKESCVRETVEDEPAIAETFDENVKESQTQCSPNIVENSLPVECSPKPLQRILQQHQLNTPTTSTSPSVISNSPQQSPCVNIARAVIISPSTVKLLEKGGANSNVSSEASKKRKTFSLESNTGEIAGAGHAAQQLDHALNQRRHLSGLSPNPKSLRSVNRIHFFKQGKLNRARKPFKVVFVKLGYLSPKLVEKHIIMKAKRFSDAAVQTHLLYFSQSTTEMISRGRSTTSGIKAHNNSVLCQTSQNITVLNDTTLIVGKNHENLHSVSEKRSKRGNSVLISQNAEVEEEEVIEKSQDLVQDHIFEEPAEKYQKKTVQETCTFDSNEIIQASYVTPTQKSRRRNIKDTSSLSMSPASGPYNTLASLNESDYEEQHRHPVKEIKRRKVARKLSEVEKDNSASGKPATESKKQKIVVTDSELEREMQWTYSSQDAVVVAAVNERRANVHADAEPIAPSKSKIGEKPGNENVRGNHISPFLEDSDTVMENTVVLNKTCYPTKLASESLQKETEETVMAEKIICEESDDEMVEGTPKSKADQAIPLSPPHISLSFSSLTRIEINHVHAFCSQFQHSSVNTSVTPGVTHLIVPQTKNMNTNSTLKFYLAVARGLWVVSSQWIIDSISAGKVIPETPYEMKNMHGSDGPKRSRLCGGEILKDFEIFCLDGDYSCINKDQLKEIIVHGGGGVVKDLDQIQIKKYRIVISPVDTVDEEKNCIVLVMDWVLESIENFKLASAFNYLPSGVTFTQISQAKYELPDEMLSNNS